MKMGGIFIFRIIGMKIVFYNCNLIVSFKNNNYG